MSVASGCGYQEVGVASGWNLLVWLVVVVVRRYIDFLILLLLYLLFFVAASLIFFVLVPVLFCNLCNNFFKQYKHTYGRLRASHRSHMKGYT